MPSTLPFQDSDGEVIPGLTLPMVRALVLKCLLPGCSVREAAFFAGVSEAAVRQKWLNKPRFAHYWSDRQATYEAMRSRLHAYMEGRALATLEAAMFQPYEEVPASVQITAAGKALDYLHRVSRYSPQPVDASAALLGRLGMPSTVLVDSAAPVVIGRVAAPLLLPSPGSQAER